MRNSGCGIGAAGERFQASFQAGRRGRRRPEGSGQGRGGRQEAGARGLRVGRVRQGQQPAEQRQQRQKEGAARGVRVKAGLICVPPINSC